MKGTPLNHSTVERPALAHAIRWLARIANLLTTAFVLLVFGGEVLSPSTSAIPNWMVRRERRGRVKQGKWEAVKAQRVWPKAAGGLGDPCR
jgi:hypothetical protein